jgi:hypothetical protein
MPNKTARIVVKDNGYFEIWEKANGEQVRINTEAMQYSFRYTRCARPDFTRYTEQRLAEEETTDAA